MWPLLWSRGAPSPTVAHSLTPRPVAFVHRSRIRTFGLRLFFSSPPGRPCADSGQPQKISPNVICHFTRFLSRRASSYTHTYTHTHTHTIVPVVHNIIYNIILYIVSLPMVNEQKHTVRGLGKQKQQIRCSRSAKPYHRLRIVIV